jgi:hypothetical protein
MTNIDLGDLTNIPTGTELKVKAATWGTFAVTLIGMVLLGTTVTDFVPALPDWIEAPAYSAIASLSTFLAGYNTRNRPGSLSPSTVEALKKWLAERAPRYGTHEQ